ncbi:MAG: DUF2510 domain-containing protein [Streptosporangiales bacterium]|nr:DUF2510 domain-containing protein [Streptosporangiales bacterium]
MNGRPPAGWYPDPYSPSLLRWWDGERWSDHTQPAEAAGPAGGTDDAGTGWATPGGHGPPGPGHGWEGTPVPAPRRSAAPWVIGGVAAFLVIALVVAGFAAGLIGGTERPVTADATPSPGPTDSAGGIVQGDRLVDQASGLSFKLLPKPWKRAGATYAEPWTAGQFAVAQQDYDGDGDGAPDGDYIASVFCGELPERYTYTGTRGLRGTATELAQSFLADPGTYPQPNQTEVTASRKMKIGAHQAWVVTAELTFPTAADMKWKWRSEETAFLVVDKGTARPAAMYISIPDNVDGTSVKDVLETVRMTS